ncbi:MAG: sulfur carrier protein ThiS [Planctomycetota bacterium]|nr:MAG: sulfur carrier protein ThiS [Planctomycetota bacterium]
MSASGEISIRVNGAAHSVRAGTSVAELVRALAPRPELVAVERNRKLVPRAEHAAVLLADGDELEIVTLVGGG